MAIMAWGGPGPVTMAIMVHELNLTDAQKAQVKTIMQANHANMKTVMQQMAREPQGPSDRDRQWRLSIAAKIQALANQQAQLQAAMTVQHEALQHQIYTEVLTSEQQAKAEQLRTEADQSHQRAHAEDGERHERRASARNSSSVTMKSARAGVRSCPFSFPRALAQGVVLAVM